MAFFIGTDEAGYGPNLGPLTVTGTLWQVPHLDSNLYELLADIVSESTKNNRLPIADSKSLYQSTGSIKTLETSVLAILYSTSGCVPSNWQELIEIVSSSEESELDSEIWLASQQLPLPLAADVEMIKDFGTRFQSACCQAEVELLRMQCCPVFPTSFNRGIEVHGNKASLLSSVTLALAAELKDAACLESPDLPMKIICDKHGGRSKYASLISQHLTNEFIWVGEERLEISSYRWQENRRDMQASFVARGESFLPTALASMISKYVREVFMELWNNYWTPKVKGLRPTKGYPLDAKRFKKEITAVQKTLGISDDSIWRKR